LAEYHLKNNTMFATVVRDLLKQHIVAVEADKALRVVAERYYTAAGFRE